MQITIGSTTISDYQKGGATATLHILSDQDFLTSDGVNVARNYARTQTYYRSVSCTVSGTTVTIPAYVLDSTTDSNVPNGTYTALLYDSNGKRDRAFYSGYKIPTAFGSSASWIQISAYNSSPSSPFQFSFPTVERVQDLIDEAIALNPGGTTVETIVSNVTEMDAAITVANANPSNSYNWILDSSVTVSTAKIVPSNVYVKSLNGSQFIKALSGTIAFAGIGIPDAESQISIFSGFAVGDITWTGSVWPSRFSTELWATGNDYLLPRIQMATAAMAGNEATIVCYPRQITGGSSSSDSAEINSYHHLYFTDGDYPNSWDATLTAAIPILLNSHTSVRSSPGARINESSVVHAYNMAIISAKMMTVSGADGTCTNIYVEDNYFVGNEAQGGSGGPSTVHLGNVINGGINRNTFYRTNGYNVFGGYGTAGNCAENVTFYDNRFIGCGTQVCAIINAKNFRIARNHFDQRGSNAQTAYTPLDVEPNTDDEKVENGIIEDNVIDCRDYGNTIATAIQVLGIGNGSGKNITIRNNTIYSTDIITTETTQPLSIPIVMSGIEEGYVYGNTIRGAAQATIYATNSRHLHIHDNEAITQFSSDTTPKDIHIQGCADSRIYNNHLRTATGWTVSASQDTGIYENEWYVPITASGSTLTFVGGYWINYFRDFYKGLKAVINNIEYTFGTYTNNTTIATTASVGTVATKTFVPSDVNTTTNVINKTAHGFVTGSFVMATTTGTLPAPMPTADTFYGQVFLYIIRIDNDNFKLALTLADALASTAIDLTTQGTGTHTLTNIMVTKFSNNKYSNNEAAMGIRLDPSGTSEILSTYDDYLITSVADTNYTATSASGVINYTSLTAARTVSLPDATTCKGKEIIIKDSAGAAATYNVTLDGNGSQTIDGSATYAINSNYGSVRIKSNGAGWIKLLSTTSPLDVDVYKSNTLPIAQGFSGGGVIVYGGVGTNFIDLRTTTLRFGDAAGSVYGLQVAGATGDMALNRTITAGGTTGAQTINKPAGSVNFAAGAGVAGLVVTNNLVTTSSIILCQVMTNDTTLKTALAVAGAGSFTIFGNANATAETKVAWWVTN
jgi:hypothetical protein